MSPEDEGSPGRFIPGRPDTIASRPKESSSALPPERHHPNEAERHFQYVSTDSI